MKRTFAGTAVLALVLAIAPGPNRHSAAATSSLPSGCHHYRRRPYRRVKVGIIDIQQAIIGTNEGARDFDALQKKFEPQAVMSWRT